MPNPFRDIRISIPIEYHEQLQRYSGQENQPDRLPFPRMIDMWFLALCIAVNKGLEPIDITGNRTEEFVDGKIFSEELHRIQALQLIAINYKNDAMILDDPREIINIANGFVAAGFPFLLDMLEGDSDPLWNLSDQMEENVDRKSVI